MLERLWLLPAVLASFFGLQWVVAQSSGWSRLATRHRRLSPAGQLPLCQTRRASVTVGSIWYGQFVQVAVYPDFIQVSQFWLNRPFHAPLELHRPAITDAVVTPGSCTFRVDGVAFRFRGRALVDELRAWFDGDNDWSKPRRVKRA